ncbi:MAG: hypothetical protein K6T99_06495 [Armatimonadetes bacterium]|nr:hypothetical protein [Armatimonadota bacterium]
MEKTSLEKQSEVARPGRPEKLAHARVLRFRAVILGLLIIPINSYWVILMEKVLPGPFPTSISLFANVIFILLIVWLLNHFIHQFAPKVALTQTELLLVYTMVAIGSALAGHDSIPVLIMMMGHPYFFANASNRWMSNFGGYLPKFVLVDDMDALKGYYNGASSLYRWSNLEPWISPVLIWAGFIFVLLFVFMCINTLVRAQWQDREKLSFPIVYLPIEMSDVEGKLYRNKLMWAGFILAGGIDFINGLHYLYPAIPEIVVKHTDLRPYLTAKPWSAVGWTPYSFYPFAIGLGFLLPVDLLFSCWFFYVFWKMQLVVSNAMAWDVTPNFPFITEQCFGGYMAIVAFLLYTGRRQLREIIKKILGRPSAVDCSNEAIDYRVAGIGAVVGTFMLVGFFVLLGLKPWLAFAGMLIYLALSVAVTRIRAELGPPVHDLHFSGPDHIITRVVGTENIDGRSLTALSYFFWFNRAYRSHPMPVLMEGLKVSDPTKSSRRFYFWAMSAACFLGTFSAFWAFLHHAYIKGTAAKFNSGIWFSTEMYTRLNAWISSPQPPNLLATWAIVIGFTFCMLLNLIRIRSVGFPFHPIGYAISGSWSMNLVWLPLFIAWLLKSLILRFGGLKTYRWAIPFFLGLILGQCVVGSFWSIYGIIFKIPTYSFWGA